MFVCFINNKIFTDTNKKYKVVHFDEYNINYQKQKNSNVNKWNSISYNIGNNNNKNNKQKLHKFNQYISILSNFYLYFGLFFLFLIYVLYSLFFLHLFSIKNFLFLVFYPFYPGLIFNEIIVYCSWLATATIIVGISEIFFNIFKLKNTIYCIGNILIWYQPIIWLLRFIIDPPDKWVFLLLMLIGYYFSWMMTFYIKLHDIVNVPTILH